jgi:hypothetical protein
VLALPVLLATSPVRAQETNAHAVVDEPELSN